MELVYLWVEKYKNIEKQGFNFSPRFTFDYNENTKELIQVKDDSETYKSIFPDNTNITAIVGENGSGKSTICNSLIASKTGIIRIYRLDNQFYYFNSQIETVKYPEDFKKLDAEDIEQLKLGYDFFSQQFINDALSHATADFNWSVKDILNPIFNTSYENIDLVRLKSLIGKVIYKYGKDITTLSEFKHCDILFTLRMNNYFDIDKRERLTASLRLTESLSNINIDDKFRILTNSQNFLLYIIYLINEEKILSGENDWLHTFDSFESMIEDHNIYKEFTDTHDIEFLIDNFDEYCKFLELFTPVNKSIKNNDLLFDKLLFARNFYPLLELSYFDEEGRQYDKLSHGERQIHSSMLLLYDKIMNSDKSNFEIILDEIETSLHPRWQKSLISELYKICKKVEPKRIHMIITSHSPFILSDLPKENVIFLEKYKKDEDENQKEGNCKIATPDIEQTFGANIHTLLSDGFFMSDGLMGEFAKGKINEIINYLAKDEELITIEKNQVKNFIEIIGENFLKEKLLTMYNKKFNIKSKDEEISELKEEIERLKNVENSI